MPLNIPQCTEEPCFPDQTKNYAVQTVNSAEAEKPFSSVQPLSHVRLFATPRTAARQASLSITNSRSLLKLMPIELVMPLNHPILCRSPLLPPSIFPSIRVFSNESALHTRWPKYWSFSFSISPSNEYSGLISNPRHVELEETRALSTGPLSRGRRPFLVFLSRQLWL